MKKKAQMGKVVGIILIVVGALVLIPLTGIILNIMKESGEQAACITSAQLSSRTKVGGIETINLNCPMKLKTITMKNLDEQTAKAKKELEKIDLYNEGSEDKIRLDVYSNRDLRTLREYVLNKEIAEEMRGCWEKLGEGQLNLFNAWYGNLLETPWEIILPKDTIPTTCVICARIKFDENIQENYPDVTSINEWLKINTVPQKAITYYDFLIDEVHDQYLFTPEWSYTTKEPVGIVFARANPQGKGYFRNLLDTFGLIELGKAESGVDVLHLIPYSKAGEYCDYLANKPPEEETK
ncbi:hypothetical protein KY345_06105 [Candidatus Woesearchaeota archaeon]|nr:hypothetical protein [Candidatus Woesearchaeota archaeon]